MTNYQEVFKTRPTRLEINIPNIRHNIKVIKKRVGKRKIMGVVKADAYGHGIIEISKYIQNDVDYLAVAYVEEALMLKAEGINKPILVLGAVNDWQIDDFLKNNIQFTGSSLTKLQEIDKRSKELGIKADVHIKIDTGMGRIGVQWDRVDRFYKELIQLKHINIVGIFTHFVNSQEDQKYSRIQIERFRSSLDLFYKYFNIKPLIHMANSGAIGENINDSFFDMVRPGISMYGYSYNKEFNKQLRPAMVFKTKVSYFKVLDKGSNIGYNRTYTTDSLTRVITLPVGYADGYPRELSNKGRVIVRDKEYTISGNVCMDQCMVDIGNGEAFNNDDVELWGENISLMDVSGLCNKTPYQLLTGLGHRVPRLYRE